MENKPVKEMIAYGQSLFVDGQHYVFHFDVQAQVESAQYRADLRRLALHMRGDVSSMETAKSAYVVSDWWAELAKQDWRNPSRQGSE